METLKKHFPSSGEKALSDIKNIAIRLEEKTYAAATSQEDYVRKISMKMLTVENNKSNLNFACKGEKSPDPV
ncbi:hypothetical protein L1049_011584 [Liquidambar formosana]|uniref:Mediator complex subunit 15 KIX domain-containing protein n=1 Tax=Liquidambar formosana TaxID=63359 RepID=A0AAP0X2C7_LIQFO